MDAESLKLVISEYVANPTSTTPESMQTYMNGMDASKWNATKESGWCNALLAGTSARRDEKKKT